MGGDSFSPSITSTEEDESSLLGGVDYELVNSPLDKSCDDEGLSTELDIGPVVNAGSGLTIRKSLLDEAAEKQKQKVYEQIWKSYDDVEVKIGRLEEARSKVLSYTPGSWAGKGNGLDWDEHDIPKMTSLLLIGPKASGKSSLINKISQVLEDGLFTSARAQVSNSTLTGHGTYFCHQYMIPRGSGSFCLCDTRGLSNDPCENVKMLKRWRKKGVRHGELVRRESDSEGLKAQLKCKAKGLHSSSKRIPINFVIFVVNAVSVLDAMDKEDGTHGEFFQQIATVFNDPVLSFKDDKPVVVVTHGDLLSLSDRVRIRFYLGELLCIPPAQQIFDIPESDDIATELTILDMLIYCLEHADRNLLANKQRADRNLHAKKQAAAEISEPWWAFFPAFALFSLVLVGSLLSDAHQANIRNRNHFSTPANTSECQGVQGSYSCSPTKESQENAVSGSCHHYARTNQSEVDSVQGSRQVQASQHRAPSNAPKQNGVLASQAPEQTTKSSHKDGIQACRTYPMMDKQENGFPTTKSHVPSDDSQKKDHANAGTKTGHQASQAQEGTKKSSKDGGTHHRVHHESQHYALHETEDTVEWQNIRYLWCGDDDHQDHIPNKVSAPHETEDTVEWHKIRYLWSGDAMTNDVYRTPKERRYKSRTPNERRYKR